MKTVFALFLSIGLATVLVSSTSARELTKPRPLRTDNLPANRLPESIDPGLRGLYESAAVDTYCIVWYNFEPSNWQGWTRVDNTAQADTFFHVDDFDGLGGGSFGGLVPLEGSKSMWCGARPNSSNPYVCSWRRAPGYGNGWNQMLVTDAINFVGEFTFSYHIVWDSEPDYDFTYVEYDAGGGNWQKLASYTSYGDSVASHRLILTQTRTKLRFHFVSDTAWGDQDGLWNTDGACIVDSITVRDMAALNNYQDFESLPVNAVDAGIWHARPATPYGTYSGLKTSVVEKDPCGENFSAQIVFFIGSPNPSSSYPGLYDTPFCAGPGGLKAPCHDEMVVSPVIDMTRYTTNNSNVQNASIPAGDLSSLGGADLRFTVYRDLPLENLVFFFWHMRQVSGGCPGQWLDYGYVAYGPFTDYLYAQVDVSTLVGASEPVQIVVGCVDMCDVWYLINGNCAEHTPSPYIDNVRLYRYKTAGPQWGYVYSFDDGFPSDEYNVESYVGAYCYGGDSSVIQCSSLLGGGIATDPVHGGPAVYLHVKATYVGPAPLKPPLVGSALAGSTGNPPVNFNYISDDGTWTVIQFDTARTEAGIVEDRYCVDLNDELFTRGYVVEHYFSARDNAGIETTWPEWAGRLHTGPYCQSRCLPTLNSDILYVKPYGTEFFDETWQYFKSAFDAVLTPPQNNVDRFWGSPAYRATSKQLRDYYQTIIYENSFWNGDDRTIPALVDWLSLSEHACGLWLCGDDAAYSLDAGGSPAALDLLSNWCGTDFVTTSYFIATGGIGGGGVTSPLVTGDQDAGVFIHGGVPDKFYLYGGCPIINDFDILEKTATGRYALQYPSFGGSLYYAGIAGTKTNEAGYPVRTMLFAFSPQFMRDDIAGAPIDRFHIVRDALAWMQNVTNIDISGADVPRAYSLAQNYPNPFNPSTTIKFDMREKSLVTIRIYSVTGQLVRTLVNGVKEAGSYSVPWDGRGDRGRGIASGLYFYKMETNGFSATKKLVMLR